MFSLTHTDCDIIISKEKVQPHTQASQLDIWAVGCTEVKDSLPSSF